MGFRLTPWTVKVDDDVAFLGLGELLPREFNRARTLRGVLNLEDESFELYTAVRMASDGRSACAMASNFGLVATIGEGLSAPWISLSPRISSWNLALTR